MATRLTTLRKRLGLKFQPQPLETKDQYNDDKQYRDGPDDERQQISATAVQALGA